MKPEIPADKTPGQKQEGEEPKRPRRPGHGAMGFGPGVAEWVAYANAMDTYSDRLREQFDAAVKEIASLKKEVLYLEREAREAVRDAVAEERWKARQGEDYGSY